MSLEETRTCNGEVMLPPKTKKKNPSPTAAIERSTLIESSTLHKLPNLVTPAMGKDVWNPAKDQSLKPTSFNNILSCVLRM
jgi:hypothetical protein